MSFVIGGHPEPRELGLEEDIKQLIIFGVDSMVADGISGFITRVNTKRKAINLGKGSLVNDGLQGFEPYLSCSRSRFRVSCLARRR